MLTQFGPGIWLSSGPVATVLGFHYPTRMAVIQLTDGSLFVWSPIALSPDLKAAVNGLGPLAHIVAPNSLHHIHLMEWIDAWPAAIVHAPPRLRAKRPDIAFGADLGDKPHSAWAEEIDQTIIWGNRITDEVAFFHRPSKTVLFTDLLQQFPDDWFSGWRRIVAKLDKMVGAEPSVPRKFRLAFTDRKNARAAMSEVLAWDAEAVVMAHGSPVTQDAQAYLRRAFRFLGV